jgi:aspartyl protease family protein
MSYSSGTRTLMGEIAGWGIAVGLVAAVAINYTELRHMTGALMGIPSLQDGASPESGRTANSAEPPRSGYSVELDASENGHYHADAEINGRPVHVMVDTGATMVALTFEDAENAGIFLKDSDFSQKASTANGMSRIAPVTIDRLSIGDITVRNVKAAVAERGRLQVTLLGMSFLSRLERVDMRSGKLLLQD